jgi:amino acid transporter
MGQIMEVGSSGIWAFAILATLASTTQVVAATVITSRFIFALARDKGIPFSKLLVTTNKHKEPWVAMAALLVSMYLATTGWLVNRRNFYSLLHAFHFYFINVPYVSSHPPRQD